MGDLENINTLSQLLLTFKSIRSGGLIQPNNITFSITASVSIKVFWFWTNDRRKRNQSRTGVNLNQAQKDELNEVYRDVQDRAEEKHDNEWIIPKL